MDSSIFTWNIHSARNAAGLDTTTKIINTIASIGAETVALQEVPSHHWISDAASSLGMFSFFHKTNSATGQGNAILSHTDASVILYKLRKHPCTMMQGEPRGAMVAHFPDFTVINTHLGADPTMYEQYMGTVDIAQRSHQMYAKPVLLVGDFNAHYISPAMNHLRTKGWRDMWREAKHRAHGYRAGCTFSARFPFPRIDYVLCNSPDVISHAACVISTPNAAESDHRGVFVKFRKK